MRVTTAPIRAVSAAEGEGGILPSYARNLDFSFTELGDFAVAANVVAVQSPIEMTAVAGSP